MAYRPPRLPRNPISVTTDEIEDILPRRRIAPISSTMPGRASYQNPEAEHGSTDYRSEIDKLYGTGEAMEKFYRHAQNVPQIQDYGPGIGGRITAALAGVSTGWQQGAGAGVGVAQKILRRPYETALEEYDLKGQGLKASADIEQARDAKRVAYLKELREFDKDEYDRLYKDAQAQNARITAEARTTQAETAAKLATLTEARDAAVDKREINRLNNEIQRTENTLTTQQEANKIRERGVQAVKERTGAMERVGHERNANIGKRTGASKVTERVITPSEQRTAEIDATNATLNDPEFESLREFVKVGKDFVDIKSSLSKWLGMGSTDVDSKLLERFKAEVEKKKKKKLAQTIRLNDNKNGDDVIDLDLDDEP